jgi:glyoxalase family protein
MKVDGLHHVTAIASDIETNLEFYGRVLGLRLIWQGVNADDPGMRHIAYGDERGSPGSIVTFFDMPGRRARPPWSGDGPPRGVPRRRRAGALAIRGVHAG